MFEVYLEMKFSEHPLFYSTTMKGFGLRNGVSLGTVRAEIREGRLAAKRLKRRVIITPEAEDDWRKSLPDANGGES